MDAAFWALALAAAGVAALLGLAALARRSDPRVEWTDDELERRRNSRGTGLLAASMRVLGEELDSGARGAAEEREALERGERPDTTPAGDPPTPDHG